MTNAYDFDDPFFVSNLEIERTKIRRLTFCL